MATPLDMAQKVSQKPRKRWPESAKTCQTHLLAVHFGRHRGYPDVFEGSLPADASAPAILVEKECKQFSGRKLMGVRDKLTGTIWSKVKLLLFGENTNILS